jgi:chromosome segregation ATPase
MALHLQVQLLVRPSTYCFSEASGKTLVLEANLAALQTELNNMKNSQVSALSDVESEISEKSEELAAVQTENKTLESEKAALESEVATLNESSSTYKKELEEMAESHLALQQQIESLNSEHSQLSAELATLQEQLAKASSERDTALTELESVKETMNQKIEEEVLRKSELDDLVIQQEQVKTLTSSLSDYEGQIAGYKSKLDEMQKLADQLDTVNGKFIVLV